MSCHRGIDIVGQLCPRTSPCGRPSGRSTRSSRSRFRRRPRACWMIVRASSEIVRSVSSGPPHRLRRQEALANFDLPPVSRPAAALPCGRAAPAGSQHRLAVQMNTTDDRSYSTSRQWSRNVILPGRALSSAADGSPRKSIDILSTSVQQEHRILRAGLFNIW